MGAERDDEDETLDIEVGGEPDDGDGDGQDDDKPPAKPARPKPDPKPAPKPADPGDAKDTKTDQTVSRAEYNALAAQLRQATKDARAKQAIIDKAAEENASEAEKALLAARKEAATEAEAKLRPAVVRAAARAALSSAGCTDAGVQKTLMRLLDTGAVELDDDGEVVDGLDEQVEDLKAQFPEKFETARRRVPSAREVDAGDKKPPAAKKSATDLLMSRLTGGGKG